MKKIFKYLIPVFPALFLIQPSHAEISELVCSTVDIQECVNGQACVELTASAIEVPPILRVNFKDKVVTGKRINGDDLSAPISWIYRTAEGVLLQGVDNGLGWSMTLTEADGSMSLAVSGDFVGYVIFGNCAPM